jgi:hypothetical protein
MRLVAGIWLAGMLAFRLLPDSAPFGRSMVGLAETIRRTPAIEGEPIATYGGAPDSISFYAGRLMREASGSSSGVLLRGLEAQAAQRTVHLLTDEDGIEDLIEKQVGFEVAASRGRWNWVRILPEASGASKLVEEGAVDGAQ